MKYADVIVPLAVEGMYTYIVPDLLEERVKAGRLVWVSFAGNKKYTAVVSRVYEPEPLEYEVKEIEGIAEEFVCILPLQLKFLLWLSEYYMANPGEVLKAALPVMFRLESFTAITRISSDIDDAELTFNEKMLLGFLRPGEYVALKDAEKYLKIRNGMYVVKALLAKGYVQVREIVDELFRDKIEYFVKWAGKFTEKELGEILDGLKRAQLQYKTLCRWIEMGKGEMTRAEFLKTTGSSLAVLKVLCKKQILQVEGRQVSRLMEETGKSGIENQLTVEQEGALKVIRQLFTTKECVLLKGVTSSGKTEVYIHLIREYLNKGEQVLYMLPEIALTIQIIKRLQRVFGKTVGIYHSGMSDQMRAELWRRQCSDTPYRLILGVRSSIFLPFRQLGLIIVDEEHDVSYKQREPAPRYQGRDAAIMLGKLFGARILLGSATPSFESYQNAVSGKYGLVELNNRYGGVQMPEIVLANLSEYRRKKVMQGSFSPLLIEEMRKVLAAGKQVILFQNRRGYASYIQCDSCGSIPKCRHCDVSLTYYKQRQVLVCRYCGSIVAVPGHCTDCDTGHYRERIPGTERIAEETMRLFPDSRFARMDLDMMSSKVKIRNIIEDFEQGKIDILIGTQMVTKGLDFENVKLVGIIDADSIVNFPDFRAEERAYSMLMQVSGRSGRKGERGKVVIQTADVKNRVYSLLLEGSYFSFFSQLSQERQFFIYPPFGRIIQVELRHKDVVTLRHAANQLASRLRDQLGKRVCGPAVPEVSRIGGWYRLLLILKLESVISCSGIKSFLKNEFSVLRECKAFGTIRIFCDVDPQ